MKTLRFARWWLKNPRTGRPYLSGWELSDEDAAARGALRIEPTTIVMREIPETTQEQALRVRSTYTGANVARPWWKAPDMIELPVLRVRWRWDMR